MLERDGRVYYREVREYLGNALPTSVMEEVGESDAGEPLLLLTMRQMVAGFGFTSRDIEGEYGELYGAFKEQYSARRSDWDRLELAFVLCVPENAPGLDIFGSEVETDVYFCRKYVVPLNGGSIGNALARLPFVPLFVEGGETGRPPSAQTFLQQCGVPATLARNLVVKGERGASKIVEDCIEGDFERPKAPSREGSWGSPIVKENAVEMRIESLEIENFRAYREARQIRFGEDLTVLYGPNGFGKTSVFDAVDFAFTGEIGRLKIRADDRFRSVANHLDGEGADGIVTLSYSMAGEQHRLVRHVNDRKRARFDGTRMNRKAVLEHLTGWRGPTVDRVENMVSLFRATHLFSQEHQELARNFRSDCALSADVVSSLLAFEDYQAGRSKLSLVCGVLRDAMSDLNAEMESLREELVADEAELDSVGRMKEGRGASADWEEVVSSLYRRVEAEGLDVPSGMPELETLRGWRMTFETRAAGVREQIEELRKCLGVVERLPRKRADLDGLGVRVEGLKVAVAKASRGRDAAEERHRAGLERMSLLERGLAQVNFDVADLAWLGDNVPKHAALAKAEAESRSRLSEFTNGVEEAERRESALSEQVEPQERERSKVLDRSEETVRKLKGARELLSAVDAWEARRNRLGEVIAEKVRAEESINELAISEKGLLESIEAFEDEQKTLATRIEAQEVRRSELSELVIQLEDHISGGVCPVCGEDHGNQEKLLDRIAEHVGEEIAKEERLQLEEVRQKVVEYTVMRDEKASSRRAMDLRQRELQRESEGLEASIGEFEQSLSEIGVAGARSEHIVRGELEGLCNAWDRQATELEEAASRIWSRLEQLRRELHEEGERVHAIRSEVERAGSERERVSMAIEQLRADPRAQREISLDSPLELVRRRRESVERQARAEEESLEQERASVGAQRRDQNEATLELEGKESELAKLLQEVAALRTSCSDMEATLLAAGIAEGESEAEVTSRIASLQRQVTSIEDLIKVIIRVELVVDSATTKAAFSRLQGKVRLLRSRRSELRDSRESYVWWVEYFEELQRLLVSEQDKAVSKFAQEYGPRTSAIQRRLRSVYGFDDVDIRSEKSRISVRVMRRGTQLRPTDYFSQSQQQTLLLGLFLTASISQTWSAMAPIFLDDPVTHFDDLNTYAFLDLIDGLLNDREAGGRQFVVSTCDEKLLQLARQKFAYRDDRARFYAFKGIGMKARSSNRKRKPVLVC